MNFPRDIINGFILSQNLRVENEKPRLSAGFLFRHLDTHISCGSADYFFGCSDIVRIQIWHLFLCNAPNIGAGHFANFRFQRFLGAFLYTSGFFE